MYTRFRPQRTEPDTAVAAVNSIARLSAEEIVTESVTVDAHDLFSQLTTQAYLGKRESTRGFLFSIQEVSEGTIRVWRDWLARQCESKKWTDGDTVIVHHDTPVVPARDWNEDPTKDPRILWVNTRDDNVGIRFRVLERTWERDRPLLYSSDVEVAVSYQVEFEEVLVRTTHLLLKLEEAEQQMANHSGKAIVFGSYAGLQEFDTSGHPRR
ncbi:hypothetical protein LTR91_023123 [Friedmanniomyces endolithicus]|uniref:Uncharacterized protein n=1 Tax=Friedmanniomyces endolithicus TaxID=329885 RepID=A0AAN6JYR6_9PEZI|nr:hypothetical protein LTR57_012820 [Friedmanniomyces endolithicus]KAK0954853.1 hypothetical protein LTR91_023123 [Friedmanniomyces endolithicus]KAK0967764.1 hypothetical protein LTS01_017060 [Friedmanniomyces endolithicus]KAK1037410.1 hypothetical protein LTS16_012958 [Friedmanniomyces endolithicus]